MSEHVPEASSASRIDSLSWAEIRRLALRHRKSLWLANGVAVLATLCSVPIPLLLPLLVDEVLLGVSLFYNLRCPRKKKGGGFV